MASSILGLPHSLPKSQNSVSSLILPSWVSDLDVQMATRHVFLENWTQHDTDFISHPPLTTPVPSVLPSPRTDLPTPQLFKSETDRHLYNLPISPVDSTSKIYLKSKHFFPFPLPPFWSLVWLTAVASWLYSSFYICACSPPSLHPEIRVILQKHQSDHVLGQSKPFKASSLYSKSNLSSSPWLTMPPSVWCLTASPTLCPTFHFHGPYTHAHTCTHIHTTVLSNWTTSTYPTLASRPPHMLIPLSRLSTLSNYAPIYSMTLRSPSFQGPSMILPSSGSLWGNMTHPAFIFGFSLWNATAWLPPWLSHVHVSSVKDRSFFCTVIVSQSLASTYT